jgi:sarcosine oxidase subunit beta
MTNQICPATTWLLEPAAISIKNAPAVGAFMSEIDPILRKGHDHDKNPLQYKMKYIKHTLNIGFFSRNREINKASSFSVIG